MFQFYSYDFSFGYLMCHCWLRWQNPKRWRKKLFDKKNMFVFDWNGVQKPISTAEKKINKYRIFPWSLSQSSAHLPGIWFSRKNVRKIRTELEKKQLTRYYTNFSYFISKNTKDKKKRTHNPSPKYAAITLNYVKMTIIVQYFYFLSVIDGLGKQTLDNGAAVGVGVARSKIPTEWKKKSYNNFQR